MIHRFACVAVLLLIGWGCREDQPAVPPPSVPTPPVTPPPSPTVRIGAAGPTTQPRPTLEPGEVVRLVTEAMGRNDSPKADAGIATAFAFASPGNRQMTGPLERFAPMVRHERYAPLLNYKTIEYGPVRVSGDFAEQVVTVTDASGSAAAFLWTLSRQPEGDYEGCWMTDGVTRLGAEPIPPEPKHRHQPQHPPEIRV